MKGFSSAGGINRISLINRVRIWRLMCSNVALSLHAGITPAQIQKGLQAYKNAPMRWEESHLVAFIGSMMPTMLIRYPCVRH